MRRILITAILILFVASGCAQNGDTNNTALNNDQHEPITVNQPNNANNNNNKNKNDKQLSGEQVAQHLVKIATSVPDVKDATAVVAGNYAVVGIDVDKDLERSRVGSIKYTVAESLKDDPYGANAVVVADADTVERLNKMRKEIQNGRPIEGVMDELAGIVGRIMPQIPYDINNHEAPNEQNEKQLNNKEQKELKQIQKEHSKQQQ